MLLREAQALVLLFRACQDHELKAKCVELVPDLKDWDIQTGAWRLIAEADGEKIEERLAVCTDGQLKTVIESFRQEFSASSFDCAYITVRAEPFYE